MQHDGHDGSAVGPHAVFTLDTSGTCTQSTGPALPFIGLRPGQLVGTNLFELYRDDPFNVAALHRVLAGESFNVEREFQGRLLSTYFEPIRGDDGTVSGGLGVTTDVTEPRRIAAQLQAARERSALLADASAELSRDFLDPEALVRTAVRFVAGAVADVGLVWVRTPGEQRLVPGAAWSRREGAGGASGAGVPDGRDPRPALALADVEGLHGAEVLDPRTAEPAFASLAADADASLGLRVPLWSRGLLLGVVDLARPAARGEYGEAEVGLVTEIAGRCALALDNALLLSAERRAREDLVKFQALADASDNLIGISDDEYRSVYVNPRVHATGLELTGQAFATATGAGVDDTVMADLRRTLETEGRWTGDVTFYPRGTATTINLAVFRIFHPETGERLGTAWIGQDVTDLRVAEAALREANADLRRFKALTDASPDFIAIADMRGRVQYVNPGGRRLVGLSRDEDVTGATIADFATPDGFERFEQRVRPEALDRGHWEGESTLRDRRGGPPIPVATATFLVNDPESGEPFALATVQRDISDRLEAEVALRELAEQRQALLDRLVDAQEAERTRIAADVHDDPVQVLAAVDVRLGHLRRRVRDRAPDLLDGLDALQGSVSGATDRLRALLFDLEPPNLEQGLTGALSRAAGEIFENSGIRWVVDGDREPPMPDPTRAIAYRIAKEAMSNVRRHSGAGYVGITVDPRDDGLEVSVEDDGVGLGPEPIESSPGHRGVLGMRDRATVAGGSCTFRNRAGGGTVVTMWLPGPSPSAEVRFGRPESGTEC